MSCNKYFLVSLCDICSYDYVLDIFLSLYRMCSLTIECVLLLWNVFSYHYVISVLMTMYWIFSYRYVHYVHYVYYVVFLLHREKEEWISLCNKNTAWRSASAPPTREERTPPPDITTAFATEN